jgi:hypothetical protein
MTESVPDLELDPDEPASRTAGEEDHENVDTFRGEPVEAPGDIGKPAEPS